MKRKVREVMAVVVVVVVAAVVFENFFRCADLL